MFISKFSVEDWQGNQNKSSVQLARNWQEIAAAINQLNGQYKTLVTLETDGETHMAIGGGDGRYVVYLTFDNDRFYYLVDPSKSNLEETLIVGGQEGVYPSKLCIDIDTTLKAAKTFVEFGSMEKSTVWEQDGVMEAV